MVYPISFQQVIEGALMNTVMYDEISGSELVNDTVQFCGLFDSESQVECVVARVGKKYNYNNTNRTKPPLFMEPDKFEEQGYICRDIAITYSAIFKRLGWWPDYVFTKNHVYNNIYNRELDCMINMDKWHCW